MNKKILVLGAIVLTLTGVGVFIYNRKKTSSANTLAAHAIAADENTLDPKGKVVQLAYKIRTQRTDITGSAGTELIGYIIDDADRQLAGKTDDQLNKIAGILNRIYNLSTGSPPNALSDLMFELAYTMGGSYQKT